VENVIISFKINQEAYIYIVWDPGAPERDWLKNNYTLTTDILNTTDAPKKIYKSNNPFPPGEVKTCQLPYPVHGVGLVSNSQAQS
jgi:hypothetical protein